MMKWNTIKYPVDMTSSITPDGWRDYTGELVECTLETGKVVKGLLRAKGNSEKSVYPK